MTDKQDKPRFCALPLERQVGRDNKVQMHVDLNEAYSVLIGLTYKLNLKAFNADLLDGRSFLSQMVDASDFPPC